ncbi:unnamed protein product, partial [Prorocentrum cordatum]
MAAALQQHGGPGGAGGDGAAPGADLSAQARAIKYRKCHAVFERYPGTPMGMQMLDKIKQDFLVRAGVQAEFFDTAGRRLIAPHELNVRKNNIQIQRFKRSILKYGNIQGVRGGAIAVLSSAPGESNGAPPWRMLTYGSVSRAVYLAVDENTTDPVQKKNVEATLSAGLVLDEYESAMPIDCAEHIRDFYNAFHGGAGITFLEIIDKVETADSEWKAHAHANGITLGKQGRGDDGCAKQLSDFLDKHYKEIYDTRELFMAARSLMNTLKKLGNMWPRFQQILGGECDFLAPGLGRKMMVKMLHYWSTQVAKLIGTVHWSTEDLARLFIQGARFISPTEDCQNWLINSMSTQNQDKMKLIVTEMADSIKAKQSKTAEAASNPSNLKLKAALKNGGERDVAWIDDVQVMHVEARSNYAGGGDPFDDDEAMDQIYSASLLFCWNTSISICGKNFTAWSVLRPKLAGAITSASVSGIRQSDSAATRGAGAASASADASSSEPSAGLSAVGAALLQVLGKVTGEDEVASRRKLSGHASPIPVTEEDITSSMAMIKDPITAFMQENPPSMRIKFHPSLTQASMKVEMAAQEFKNKSLGEPKTHPSISDLMKIIAAALPFKLEWMDLAADITEFTVQQGGFPGAAVSDLFADAQSTTVFGLLRDKYAMSMLHQLVSEDGQFGQSSQNPASKHLFDIVMAVPPLDSSTFHMLGVWDMNLKAKSIDYWVQAWASLFDGIVKVENASPRDALWLAVEKRAKGAFKGKLFPSGSHDSQPTSESQPSQSSVQTPKAEGTQTAPEPESKPETQEDNKPETKEKKTTTVDSIVGFDTVNTYIGTNVLDAMELERDTDSPVIMIPKSHFQAGMLKALCKAIESHLFIREFQVQGSTFDKIKVDSSNGRVYADATQDTQFKLSFCGNVTCFRTDGCLLLAKLHIMDE